MTVAIYERVSSRSQKTDSQHHDLATWAKGQMATGVTIRWHEDTFTGKSMERPGMTRLLTDIRAGRVKTLVVWRLDRLGRTAKGLTALFDELVTLKVGFVSLRDGIDLCTPAGRLIANVLASVAAYETEVRGERIAAGKAAKAAKIEAIIRAGGTPPVENKGGRPKGSVNKVTPTVRRMVSVDEGRAEESCTHSPGVELVEADRVRGAKGGVIPSTAPTVPQVDVYPIWCNTNQPGPPT